MVNVVAALLLATGAYAAPTFEVDLDLPPHKRWVEVARHYKEMMPDFLHAFARNVSQLSMEEQQGFIDHANIPEEIKDELSGFVDTISADFVTQRALIFANLMHETGTGPTLGEGTVASKSDGTVIQGRNLDFSFPFTSKGKEVDLKDYLFDVTFKLEGKPLMTSVHFPGQVGIHTAMRLGDGGWSVVLNAQGNGTKPREFRKASLEAALKGAPPASVSLRKTMEEVSKFSHAVRRIEKSRFMAPQSILMAGATPDAGAVLSVDRGGTYAAPFANAEALSGAMGRWFLVSGSGVKWTDQTPTVTTLAEGGQGKLSEGVMLRMLRTDPLATPRTAFSWVGCPATGFHRTVLQNEPATLQPMKEVRATSFLKLKQQMSAGAQRAAEQGQGQVSAGAQRAAEQGQGQAAEQEPSTM